jgi:hypothetical protein
LAVLADGRVVTGGDDRRVLVWDPDTPGTVVVQLSCSVAALAAAPPGLAMVSLVIAHQATGFSAWSIAT